jgi:hypothetical protein
VCHAIKPHQRGRRQAPENARGLQQTAGLGYELKKWRSQPKTDPREGNSGKSYNFVTTQGAGPPLMASIPSAQLPFDTPMDIFYKF